jgi:hypothetical protein
VDELRTLTDIGLSEKEARIYLCLLETGPTSTDTIALKTKIKRPTVYFVLEGLIDRALVLRTARKRKQLFAARAPDDLLSMERGRMKRLSELVPILQARAASHGDSEARTLLFEGERGVHESLFYRIDELHGSEVLGFYGTALDISNSLHKTAIAWNTYNTQHDIQTRAVVPNHASLKQWRELDKEHHREVRVVPYDQYSADTSMEITPYFTRITMWDVEQSLIIESEKVARAWRSIFEMVWNSQQTHRGLSHP